MRRTAPQQRINEPQMSIVPKLRDPALQYSGGNRVKSSFNTNWLRMMSSFPTGLKIHDFNICISLNNDNDNFRYRHITKTDI